MKLHVAQCVVSKTMSELMIHEVKLVHGVTSTGIFY